MIDIHSHVLPGLDDGARTIDESLEMLHLAAASGTTDIVATPHANSEFCFDHAKVKKSFLELAEQSSSFISLHLGCDFHLSYENVSNALNNPSKYTINNTRYLLVELPDLLTPSMVHQGLRQLIRANLIPVITHPERNVSLQCKLDELMHWMADGSLVQVTAQSFLGRFGPIAKNISEKLMSKGLIHFVASDAHDCVDRMPDLSEAYQYVSSRYGTEHANSVFTYNPACAIAGESLASNPSQQKSQSFLGFGKSRTA
jgi:protein-tyrosine phosphatase